MHGAAPAAAGIRVGHTIQLCAAAVLMIGASLLCMLLVLTNLNGSIPVFAAQLLGRPLAFSAAGSKIVHGETGDMRVVSFEARNLTSSTIRLIGSETFCGCMTVDNVPMAIPAHSTKTFRVKWAASNKKALDAGRMIKIFSDNPAAFSNQIALPN